MLALAAGAALGALWAHRLIDTALGMPTLADVAQPAWAPPARRAWPRLSVIVPARNEAAHVEDALRSLLASDYPDLEIIAVDDRSGDATGTIMERLAQASSGRITVLRITELPPRWLGKVHAMWRAAQQSTGDWLLFTDADVVFAPSALTRAVHYAMETSTDHLVLAPTLDMRTAGERIMIAFFQLQFVFGHRPWKISDPKSKDHMGVGAFNLVRRQAYEKVGTYATLRMEVLDDMRLGKVIKDNGLRQRMAVGPGLVTVRWAHGAMGVVRNLTKNMFALLQFRWAKAFAAIVALLAIHLGPWIGLVLAHGWARAGFAVAVFVIACMYLGMALRSRVPFWCFLTHPIATLVFAYILLRSVAHAFYHGGVVWRGTRYPLEELRDGLV